MALAQFDTERAHLEATRRWAQAHLETPEGDQLLLSIVMATSEIRLLRYDPRQERLPEREAVRAAAQRLGDRAAEGRALTGVGVSYHSLGEIRKAIVYYEQRLALARAVGDRLGEASALSNLGISSAVLGEPAKAVGYHEQDLVIRRELGDRRGEAVSLNWLGFAYALCGEPQTAVSCYGQALPITRELGDHQTEGLTLIHLGNAATDLGDIRQGIARCEAGLALLRAIGSQREEGYALTYLARALAVQGDLAKATASFDQAIALFERVDEPWSLAECQWCYGMALAQRRLREQALPLLRAALAYKRKIGHAQEAEHAAFIACLEAGSPAAQPPSQSAEKAEARKIPSAQALSTDKKRNL